MSNGRQQIYFTTGIHILSSGNSRYDYEQMYVKDNSMNKLLENCVCGGDAYIKPSTFGYSGYCNKYGCGCRTPVMMCPDEASIAWNTMQHALKSSWTSDTPTEDGMYLYLTVKGENFYVKGYGEALELKKPCMVRVHGNRATIDAETYDLSEFKGAWYLIQYPSIPKDLA